MSTHLIVFVKNPVAGEVKTRLLTRFSPQQSADIYRAFILDTLELARTVPADRHLIAYSPNGVERDIRSLAGPGWQLTPQSENDLGDRMYQAAEPCFEEKTERVIIIGTDIPSLPPSYIQEAFNLLIRKDVVLGPSMDGGYYLIGLTGPFRQVFQDIEWSTKRVFGQTLKRVESSRLKLGLVPPWYDVDTPEDLDYLVAHARGLMRSSPAPILRHTRACLSTLT